ncbi:hypothetical protein EJ08DRAFT_645312 [Tothia fuscella]|uniref:Uncharacterized protein n=1 Tax=Tothia fuscella TaxID=1048955 RepID=A0A9P4P1J8_9PEZI|nr:hypothetical protein EJ08DRAFT_645312 [Tothia fuscella]
MAVMDELNNSPEQRRQMGAGLRNLLLQQERAQHVGDPQAQEPHQPSAEDYDIPTHQANQLRQPTPILEERESQGKPSSSSCQKHDYDRGAYDAASSPHGDTHPSVSDTNAARSRPWTTRPAHVHDPPDLGRRIPSPLDVGGTTGSSSTSEPLTRESKAQDALSSPIKTHAAKKNHTTTMTPPLKADYPVSDVWSDVGSGWDFGGAASSVADSAHLSRFTGVGGLDDESDFFAPEVEKNRVANRAADGFELRRRAAEQHRALAAQTPPATAGRAQSPIDIGSSEDRHTHNVAGMPLESSLADQSWSSSPRTLGLSTTKTRSPQ